MFRESKVAVEISSLVVCVLIMCCLLFPGCFVKSLDGNVVYSSVEQQKKKSKPKRTWDQNQLQIKNKPDSGMAMLYAGIRRSPYGLSTKNEVDGWWIDKAKKYAETISRLQGTWAQPIIIEIVSGFMDDGTTEMWFNLPREYKGSSEYMTFNNESGINHERALSKYDHSGVKAIIQFEPGNADVAKLIEIAYYAFKQHPCIIGYGIDAEWYRSNASAKAGEPISDEDAKRWMEKVVALDPTYTLFLKHWEPEHLPQNYRHPNMWFLSDSQDYRDMQGLMENFTLWDTSFAGQTVGYQIGYESDQRWWKNLDDPVVDFSKAVFKTIPRSKFIFWVDFTADEVEF